MAGVAMRIIPLQQFDSGGILPVSTTAIVYTVRKIDTSRFREASILARLHAIGTWPTGATAVFDVSPDGYTDDDPAQIWAVPAAATVVTFTNTTDPALSVRAGSVVTALGFLPPLIQVRLKLITAAATGQIKLTLSADLNIKGE